MDLSPSDPHSLLHISKLFTPLVEEEFKCPALLLLSTHLPVSCAVKRFGHIT